MKNLIGYSSFALTVLFGINSFADRCSDKVALRAIQEIIDEKGETIKSLVPADQIAPTPLPRLINGKLMFPVQVAQSSICDENLTIKSGEESKEAFVYTVYLEAEPGAREGDCKKIQRSKDEDGNKLAIEIKSNSTVPNGPGLGD